MNETLADTLAEFRKFALRAAEEDKMISPESVLLLADKVEAAAQREKVEAVTIAATKAVNLTDEKWWRDTGNATALREALVKTLDAFKSGAIRTEWNDPDSWKHDDELWYLKNDIESAISATPRNCDVGTAEEQWDRFTKFCGTHLFCSHCPVKPLWNFEKGRKPSCGLLWAQMPYEAEGGAE